LLSACTVTLAARGKSFHTMSALNLSELFLLNYFYFTT
jgi:hypothetical protein